jgi:hypothetical protein
MFIFRTSDKCMYAITGSTEDGMHGGINSNQSHHDHDLLLTIRKIKLEDCLYISWFILFRNKIELADLILYFLITQSF